MDIEILTQNNMFHITRTNLDKIDSEQKLDTVCDYIHDKIIKGETPFPYKKNYVITNPMELFRNLMAYKPMTSSKPKYFPAVQWTDERIKKEKYRDSYLSFENRQGDYERIDILVDYFNEELRMKGRLNHQQYSPIDAWNNRSFIKRALQRFLDENKTDDFRSIDLRELIWKEGLECNSFKATLASSVYWYFDAKRILDISAGWGDRLLGAIAHYADRYLGFDPNTELQTGYNAIKNMFLTDRPYKGKFDINPIPFEEADLTGETFDLIFTSPPYFDFEVYVEDDEHQSMVRYNTLNSWLVNFLFTSLKKAWSVLEEGGNMIIHINDPNYPKQMDERKKHRFVESMILFVGGWCEGSVFDGAIASIGESVSLKRPPKPRPMWAFYNDSKYRDNQYKERCRQSLKRNYRDLYELTTAKFS